MTESEMDLLQAQMKEILGIFDTLDAYLDNYFSDWIFEQPEEKKDAPDKDQEEK